ncbi:hypothetical protein EHQ43_17435 [Leptospira bouyouniensis]|uniref:Uncharacterized protein n=1 Tax=Leptospira bouyouniensis TaxID=2484911 RepID=A0A7I0HP68_9LEPT|nr:hypothetical protein [Leptospira bouyouniensis]TGL03539.1 hypothetical protein EHQ43_17435 [Leptospira bouyouniensis]
MKFSIGNRNFEIEEFFEGLDYIIVAKENGIEIQRGSVEWTALESANSKHVISSFSSDELKEIMRKRLQELIAEKISLGAL